MLLINEEIIELENKLEELKKYKSKLQELLKTLKVGDLVYIHGIYDDYFPQIIEHIDIDKCLLYVYEKSIDKKDIIQNFYLLINDEFVYTKELIN